MASTVKQALTKLTVATIPPSGRWQSTEQAREAIETYAEALRDLPAEAIAEACRRWVQVPERGRWWPALADLRVEAEGAARAAKHRAAPAVPNGHPVVSAAERAGVPHVEAVCWFGKARLDGSTLLVPSQFFADCLPARYGAALERMGVARVKVEAREVAA